MNDDNMFDDNNGLDHKINETSPCLEIGDYIFTNTLIYHACLWNKGGNHYLCGKCI